MRATRSASAFGWPRFRAVGPPGGTQTAHDYTHLLQEIEFRNHTRAQRLFLQGGIASLGRWGFLFPCHYRDLCYYILRQSSCWKVSANHPDSSILAPCSQDAKTIQLQPSDQELYASSSSSSSLSSSIGSTRRFPPRPILSRTDPPASTS